jgi:hypothetical protein
MIKLVYNKIPSCQNKLSSNFKKNLSRQQFLELNAVRPVLPLKYFKKPAQCLGLKSYSSTGQTFLHSAVKKQVSALYCFQHVINYRSSHHIAAEFDV